jgi:hypothetical protein
MKNFNFALVLASLILSGCVMKTKILDAGAVSMTHQNLKEGETLKETGPVKGEFCADSMHDKGNIGLLDEAIKNAQTQNNVDYITNASFYTNGQGCISVEGTGNTVITASAEAVPASKKRH